MTFVLLSLGAIIAACAGTLEQPERFTSESKAAPLDAGAVPSTAHACADVASTVLVAKCATAGCHGASSPAASLDLVSPGLASRLVGVPAKTDGLLVDPAAPEQSVMVRRVQPTAPGRMPVTGDPLDDATLSCYLSWIEGLTPGAPAEVDAGVVDSGKAPPAVVARVAAGATADYPDHAGNVWSADNRFTGGATIVAKPTVEVSGTMDPTLYNGQRYGVDPTSGGAGSFSYSFDVANGNYEVVLMFAELFANINAAGGRRFDVAINGATVLKDFDIFAEAGGRNIAVDKTFPVAVTTGKLVLEFKAGLANNPKVDAIMISTK